MASDSVLFSQYTLPGGRLLAHAELNVPSTLNSLSLEMIDLLQPKLDEWARTPGVAAVFITGAGDRAFCAGGDIQALYHAMRRNHQAGSIVDRYPFDFFEREYRLDYCLHTYPKPVVVLGNGVVMGGGASLTAMAAAKRTITRPLDMLPWIVPYALAVLWTLATGEKRRQRLGDIWGDPKVIYTDPPRRPAEE